MGLEADGEFLLLFQSTAVPDVPTCYYDTIPSYAASNIQYLPTGITTDLAHLRAPASARAASRSLSTPVSLLRLSVVYHTENMLQFKVISSVVQVLIFHTEFLQLHADERHRNTVGPNPSFYGQRRHGPER